MSQFMLETEEDMLGYLDVNLVGGGMMSWEGNGMPLSK